MHDIYTLPAVIGLRAARDASTNSFRRGATSRAVGIWTVAILCATVLKFATPGVAHGQEEIFVADPNTFSVRVYPRTASGDIAPLRVITGGDTGLHSVHGVAVDEVHGEVFVVNTCCPASIVVHDRFANGNVPPRRVITTTLPNMLSLPMALALDLVHDEIILADEDRVVMYARTATGAATPLRVISGPATKLGEGAPFAVAVDSVRDEIYVNVSAVVPFLVVHSRTANGNAVPLRFGSPVSSVGGIALDTVNSELFVTNPVVFDSVHRVAPDTLVADSPPISGSLTGLSSPQGIAADTLHDELFVTDDLLGSIAVFRLNDQGNVAPLRKIAGPKSQLSKPVAIAVASSAPAGTPKLVNLSTRGDVGTGNNVLIGGLIIGGTAPKNILVRGRGPSLSGAPFFIPGVLANPVLGVFSGSHLIARNDDWQGATDCSVVCGAPAEIIGTGLDPCQPNPGQGTPPPDCALEAAILMTLPPGAYTVQLSGAGGGTGIGLVEAFDVDGATPSGELRNISTRGAVGTGYQIMIGGLIVQGTGPKKVLVRGRGPSMAGAPFFVPGILPDPFLRIFSGATVIAQNDNWLDAPSCDAGFVCGGAAAIIATGLDPCQPNPGQETFPPDCTLESAILITLPAGAYTLQVSGASGETGVGLVEAFEMPF